MDHDINGSPTWVRATRHQPCPICGKPDWCAFTEGLVLCMRTESPRPSRGDAGGWLHARQDAPANHKGPALVMPSKKVEKPDIDWAALARRYASEITDAKVQALADSLRVDPIALRELGIGFGVFSGEEKGIPYGIELYTFPMFDETGAVCGLRTRNPVTGEKKARKWSKLGIIRRQRPDDGMLLICEGESDTAAALSYGFDAIGRPGVATCAGIAAAYAAGRYVVVVADNDGDNATAAAGVWKLVAKLVETANSVRMIRPPDGIKDLRAWRQSGATADDVQRAIDAAPMIDRNSAGAAHATAQASSGQQREKPIVLIEPGYLREDIAAAESALLGALPNEAPDGAVTIYQRKNLLVRLAKSDGTPTPRRGIVVPTHVPTIERVQPTYLRAVFESVATFQRLNEEGEPYDVSCPRDIATGYIQSSGHWRIPMLRGVVTAPTMRTDGSVLQVPGYDSASKLMYDPCGIDFPSIPDAPTIDDARAAAMRILEIVRHFDFVDEGARAVWLAALLTAMVRAMLPAAPMFIIDAPTRGSGKSKLANVISVIATGQPPATMSLVDDVDEVRKRILALLLQGTAVVNIDNVDMPVGGAALCSVLTEPTYSDRILGASEIVRVPTTSTWIVTGNNTVISGDMTRRVLVCRLDPRCERPEERHFEFDPVAVAEENRPALVADALIILRAHLVAGRPQCGIRPFGSFEVWSEIIRAAIVWIGLADPIAGRQAIVEQDGGAGAIAELLRAWFAVFGNRAMTVRLALTGASQEMLDAVDEVIGADVAPGNRSRRLGQVLSQWRDRIVGGYQAVRGLSAHGNTGRWSVVQIEPADDRDGGNGGNGGNPAANEVWGPHDGVQSEVPSPTDAQVPPDSPVPPSLAGFPNLAGPDDGTPEQPGGRRRSTRAGGA